MMKTKTLTRSVSLLVSALLAASTLTSCLNTPDDPAPGGENGSVTVVVGTGEPDDGTADPENGEDETETVTIKKTPYNGIYDLEELDVDLSGTSYIKSAVTFGDSVAFTATYSVVLPPEEQTVEHGIDSGLRVYEIKDGKAGIKYDFADFFEFTPTGSRSSNVTMALPLSDGTVWIYRKDTEENTTDPQNPFRIIHEYLVHLDKDGNELAMVEPSLLYKEGIDMSGFYIIDLYEAPDSGVLAYSHDTCIVLDANGNVVSQEKSGITGDYLSNVCRMSDGSIFGIQHTYDPETYGDTRKVLHYTPDTGVFSEFEKEFTLDDGGNLFPTPEAGKALVSRLNTLSLYDFNTGKNEKLFDYTDCGMSFRRVSLLCSDNAGNIYACEYDKDYANVRLVKLTKPAKATEKCILTFGTASYEDTILDGVIEFNKANEDYMITFADYSVHTDETGAYRDGTAKLDEDIRNGKAPDLFAMDGIDALEYIRNGLLLDLRPAFEKNESFRIEDYYENILTAAAGNGRIYTVIPGYLLNTFTAKEETFGSVNSIGVADLADALKKYPAAEIFSETEKSIAIDEFMQSAYMSFIDLEKNECHFDSWEFLDILGIIGGLPESIDWNAIIGEADDDYYVEKQKRLAENRTILCAKHIANLSEPLYEQLDYEGPMAFVGYPTYGDACGTAIESYSETGVSASTEYPEACAAFLLSLIDEETQSDDSFFALPVNRKAMKNRTEEVITYFRNLETTVADIDEPLEPADLVTAADCRAMCEKIDTLAANVTVVNRFDTELKKIIRKSLDLFASGELDAKATAKAIQNDVTAYLAK